MSQIARANLERDATQLEYYEQITKNMVGQVLTKRRRIASKEGDSYRLDGYEALASHEVEELMSLCHKKIAQYETQRGEAIWEHRKRLGRIFSGTDRYEVLKEAKFRCVLCGISAEERSWKWTTLSRSITAGQTRGLTFWLSVTRLTHRNETPILQTFGK